MTCLAWFRILNENLLLLLLLLDGRFWSMMAIHQLLNNRLTYPIPSNQQHINLTWPFCLPMLWLLIKSITWNGRVIEKYQTHKHHTWCCSLLPYPFAQQWVEMLFLWDIAIQMRTRTAFQWYTIVTVPMSQFVFYQLLKKLLPSCCIVTFFCKKRYAFALFWQSALSEFRSLSLSVLA
jgi:hypothetical protein